jgi:hypothetical protein
MSNRWSPRYVRRFDCSARRAFRWSCHPSHRSINPLRIRSISITCCTRCQRLDRSIGVRCQALNKRALRRPHEVWESSGLDGWPCWRCREEAIGRRLVPADFKPGLPCNSDEAHHELELRARMGLTTSLEREGAADYHARRRQRETATEAIPADVECLWCGWRTSTRPTPRSNSGSSRW